MQFRVECDLVDLSACVEVSGVGLEVRHIPDIQFSVFASSGDIFSIGSDGDCVDLSLVGNKGVLHLDVSVPDLKSAIPSY